MVVHDEREDGGYVTPAECKGEDAVFVSRIRKDPTVANGLPFWCVSDNLRKGAALNAVQIAESAGRPGAAGQEGGLTAIARARQRPKHATLQESPGRRRPLGLSLLPA